MKSKSIIYLIALISIFTSSAQSFIGLDIGFNIPTAGAALPAFEEIKLANGATVPDTTALVASLNVGPKITFRYGNWISDNVALGISIGYLTGITKGDFETYLGPGVIAINTVSGKMLNITPSITLSTNNTESKALYIRSGLTLGFGFNTKVETEVAAAQASSVREFVGGSALGFVGALGGRKDLSEKLALYAELALTSLMHKPKELEVVSTDPSGTQEVTFNIVETTGPNSSPLDIRTYAIPYSSIALNVGLIFKL